MDKDKAGRLKSYIKTAKTFNDTATVADLEAQLLEVEEPKVDDPRGRHLQGIFSRLSLRRSSGVSGPNPLQPTEMEAWCRLNRVTLEPWEVLLLERMDSALLSAVAKASAEEQTS